MNQAILNEQDIAVNAGWLTVFNYDSTTRQYLSESAEYLAVGVGIPANSCTDAPGKVKAGKAICRSMDGTKWEYVPDYRGEVVYKIDTGEPVQITIPGDYPSDTTSQSPTTPYDKWDGKAWVTDEVAKHVAEVNAAEIQKESLLSDAQRIISLWQTELQLQIISDSDKACLIDWLSYIKQLKATTTDTAPNISWPTPPTSETFTG